jgi:rod shape-determining protein MreD
MKYKTLILVLFLYFLTLFQGSFLSHFDIFGASLNLVLIFVCLLSFFEGSYKYSGIVLAFFAGFFVDIFSKSYLGASILLLIIIYFLIKQAIYILRDVSKKYSIFYFLPIFICSIVFYDFFIGLVSGQPILFLPGIYILSAKIIYNLFFAIIGFYIIKKYPALVL